MCFKAFYLLLVYLRTKVSVHPSALKRMFTKWLRLAFNAQSWSNFGLSSPTPFLTIRGTNTLSPTLIFGNYTPQAFKNPLITH